MTNQQAVFQATHNWKPVSYPAFHKQKYPVPLSDQTMAKRKEAILRSMKEKQLTCLAIYCDLEHGANFSYLTGFITRFEEAMLILHQDGEAYLLLGNENTKMANHSRIPAICIHVPFFSLPNQPMLGDAKLTSYLVQAGITKQTEIGIVGWKHFTSTYETNEMLFDVPHYIVATIQSLAKTTINATGIFIDPSHGARITNNANEIAHYEYGASLASDGMLAAMDAIAIGKTEIEIAAHLQNNGQHPNVVTICATGERFENANLYPTNKQIQLGDKMSLTIGFKGGLSSRSGYAVLTPCQLPIPQQDYLDVIAGPYFIAIVHWLETIHIGMNGGDMYETMEAILPKDQYHWEWNPGHLTADEEWLSSPFYANSSSPVVSGMLLQIDIIPSRPGYAGVSTESTIALADQQLRDALKQEYPELWETIVKRQTFIREELGIDIRDEVLPMSDTVAYWRPFLLHKENVMVIRK